MKKCPFCAEAIQDEAIICRFCGRDLPVIEPPNAQKPIDSLKSFVKEEKLLTFFVTLTVVILVCITMGGMVAICAIVTSPNYSFSNAIPNLSVPSAVIQSTSTPLSIAQPTPVVTIHAIRSPTPFIPSATPFIRATTTPNRKTRFEECVQFGRDVRYVITSSKPDANILDAISVSLTWQNDTGGTEQGDYLAPLCLYFGDFVSGDFLYISAQITSDGYGNAIECFIYDGTQVVAHAKANGFASIATCSGSK